MSGEARVFIVDGADAGLRLDKFLAGRLVEYSRTELQKFPVRRISVSSSSVSFSTKVKPGEEYEVMIPARPDASAVHGRRPSPDGGHGALDILFEDSDIIVVNKPRGVAMYPGAGRDSGTFVQMVLAHAELSAIGGPARPGVVHRLDKDTSGVVIFAKTDAAHRALVKTFAAHDLVRKYVAFVWGVPNWESADIEGNIGRGARSRQKMTMLKIGGKPAKTHVDVMNVCPRLGVSEFRCALFTGRTHQIRVHLSAHGFPVLCDPLYGRGAARLGSVKNPALLEFLKTHAGQMLHAEVLELAHPTTGLPLKFRAKLPPDMAGLKEIIIGCRT
jgi:23S rRNA pseudouridine1911/1915/1917 synthase